MSEAFTDICVDHIWHTDSIIMVSDCHARIAFLPTSKVRFKNYQGNTPGLFDGLEQEENILLQAEKSIAEKNGLVSE